MTLHSPGFVAPLTLSDAFGRGLKAVNTVLVAIIPFGPALGCGVSNALLFKGAESVKMQQRFYEACTAPEAWIEPYLGCPAYIADKGVRALGLERR